MILIQCGVSCNLHCTYCYNSPVRNAHAFPEALDLAKVKEAVRALREGSGGEVVLHGGEPLRLPLPVLEELLRFSFELTGRSGLQTNLTVLRPEHIELFHRYGTVVGASCDGPGRLNRFRADEETTERIIANLRTLHNSGVPVGLIVVLSRANAGDPEALKALRDWVLELSYVGIGGRLNPCCHPSDAVQLTPEELVDVYGFLGEALRREGYGGWTPYRDIIARLQGRESVCTFMGCWPYSTPCGIMVLPDGTVSVCNKFHIRVLLNSREPSYPNPRTEALKETDCAGCKYFEACRGGCPSHGEGFDWRNKDRFCPVWRSLFAEYESLLRHVGCEVRL